MSATQDQPEKLTSSVKDHAASAYNYAQRSLDRVVEPSTRRRAYDASYTFASTRPFIFSAAAALVVFSALPILLFTLFAVSVAAVAVGGGVLFTLLSLALGLLVLIPTLGVASLAALLVWAWAAGTFVIGRAVYRVIVSWDASHSGGANVVAPQSSSAPPAPPPQSQLPTPPQSLGSPPASTVRVSSPVTETKFKQAPPVPQFRPEKKATNGNAYQEIPSTIGTAA